MPKREMGKVKPTRVELEAVSVPPVILDRLKAVVLGADVMFVSGNPSSSS